MELPCKKYEAVLIVRSQGMKNERKIRPSHNHSSLPIMRADMLPSSDIVATSIYYYSVYNCTESAISFRGEADLDMSSPGSGPLSTVYGASTVRDEPAYQTLGTVKTPQNRLLAFPNTLQHRVHPFKLADSLQKGHCRFLVLWLVDPHYRVASTANVPPQQHDWIAPETIDKVLEQAGLAQELQDMITEHTDDYPMSLKTAKEVRVKLLNQRKKFMPKVERLASMVRRYSNGND